MPATLLDGNAFAKELKARIAADVAAFVAQGGPQPTLAAVLVGADPASQVYIKHKRKACEQLGLASRFLPLPAETSQGELLAHVTALNADMDVHGILVQLPLPKHIDTTTVLDAISPLKDVDAFHPENVGRLSQGRPRFAPCTPAGIVELLKKYQIPVAGRHAVIVGRSDIVGKPMGLLLVQRGEAADATVTIAHSRTPDLGSITRQADILIVAIGKANFITADMVRPGAVVIDVGMNRLETGLVGDVDFAAVKEVASAITPVPGGVGPLTVTMLMQNTLTAARLHAKR